MKKQIVLLLISLFAISALLGQKHLIGVKGGVSYTNVTVPSFSMFSTRFKAGFSEGLTYEYKFKDWISLETGFMYQQFGRKKIIIPSLLILVSL